MKLRTLIIVFAVLWLVSAFAVPLFSGDLNRAGNFGDSFGGVSALFSGLALAMAVNSMMLQQKQSAEFEKVTIGALEQQAAAIKLIEKSLVGQANAARVVAITALIDQAEQRIDSLREWGRIAGDENKYANGIRTARQSIEKYQVKLNEHANV